MDKFPEYHYNTEEEEQKPTFISSKETAVQPKKLEDKADKSEEGEAFSGQKESKQAAYDSFKFAVEHDPKDDYLKSNFLQHKDQINVDVPTPAPKESKKLDQKQIDQEKEKRLDAKH